MGGTKSSMPAGQMSSNRVVKTNHKTVAARFNIGVLRSMEKELLKDPEANIGDLLSSSYPKYLKSFREGGENAQYCSIPNYMKVSLALRTRT